MATKRIRILAVLAVLCLLAAGTVSAQVQNKKFSGPADQTYYMCTFVSGVEYWVAAFEGFKDAAKQLGVKADLPGRRRVRPEQAGDGVRADHLQEPGRHRPQPRSTTPASSSRSRRPWPGRSPWSPSPATPPPPKVGLRHLRQRQGRPVRRPHPGHALGRQGQGHGHPQHPVQPPDARQHLRRDHQGGVPGHPGGRRDPHPAGQQQGLRRRHEHRPEAPRPRRGVLPRGPLRPRRRPGGGRARRQDQGPQLRHGRRHPRR